MEATAFQLLMLQKDISSKQKKLQIKDYALSLGNIQKNFKIDDRKKPQ